MNMMDFMRPGANPQQMIMSMLENQMSSSPLGQNLLSLAKNNNYNGIEQIARNICASQGRDFDTEFSSFKQSMGIK